MATAIHPRAWLTKRRARHDADYWISHGFEGRYPWRVAELTCEGERKACARALHHVIQEVDGKAMPGATPLRRGALRPHIGQLRAIEARLRDDEPVACVGMLAVNDLLTSPDSCLVVEVESVEPLLRSVLVKLKPQPQPQH